MMPLEIGCMCSEPSSCAPGSLVREALLSNRLAPAAATATTTLTPAPQSRDASLPSAKKERQPLDYLRQRFIVPISIVRAQALPHWREVVQMQILQILPS